MQRIDSSSNDIEVTMWIPWLSGRDGDSRVHGSNPDARLISKVCVEPLKQGSR